METKELSFNDAVAEIETILAEIEEGNLDVDKLAENVKRASLLIALCQKKLKTAESEIEKIFKDEEKK